MSTRRRLVQAGGWLTMATLVGKLASTAALPALARILGPQALGVYSLVFSLAQSIQQFSSLGIEVAVQRNGAQAQGAGFLGRLFGASLVLVCGLSILGGAGVWLLRVPLATYVLARPELAEWVSAAAAIAVLWPIGNLLLAFLASMQQFRAYALRSSANAVAAGLLTVALAWWLGLVGALLGLICAAAVQILWTAWILTPMLRARRVRLQFDQLGGAARSILAIGVPFYVGNTLLGSLAVVPVLGLLSQSAGIESLGYLRIAQAVSVLVSVIPGSIAPAVLSYLSSTLVSDRDAYQSLKSFHLRAVWILVLVPTALISVVMPDLVVVAFGPAYAAAGPLIWLALWVAALAALSDALVQYLVVRGQTRRIAWVSSGGVACWLALAVSLIPRLGALGYLLAQGVAHLLSLGLVVRVALADIPPADRRPLQCLALYSIVLATLTRVASSPNVERLAVYASVVGCTALVVALLYRTALHPAERLTVWGFLRSRLRLGLR